MSKRVPNAIDVSLVMVKAFLSYRTDVMGNIESKKKLKAELGITLNNRGICVTCPKTITTL